MLEVKTTLSARITDDNRNSIQDFLRLYQEKFDVKFDNFRAFMEHIAVNENLFTAVTESAPSELDQLKPELIKYAVSNKLPLETLPVDIAKHALTAEPKPIEPANELITDANEPVNNTDYQALLVLSPIQHDVYSQINQNRNLVFKKENKESETFEDTLIEVLFHPSTSCNWSGRCFTGNWTINKNLLEQEEKDLLENSEQQ